MRRILGLLPRKSFIYLLVLVMIMAASAGLAMGIGNYVQQKNDATIISELEKNAETFKEKFERINTLLAASFQQLSTLNVLDLELPFSDQEQYDLYTARQALNTVFQNFGEDLPAQDIIMYLTKSGVGITSNTVYRNENLCNLYFEISEHDFEQLIEDFMRLGVSQCLYKLEGKNKEHLLLLRRFSMRGSSDYIIGIAHLKNDFLTSNVRENSVTYIATAYNEIFVPEFAAMQKDLPAYSQLDTKKLIADSYIVFSMQIFSGYRMATAIDIMEYASPIVFIWVVAIGLGMLTATAINFIIYRSQKQNNLQISQIADMIHINQEEFGETGNVDFEQLCLSLNRLISRQTELYEINVAFQQNIEKNATLMRESFIRLLILGMVPHEEEKNMLDYYGLQAFECYRVILIAMESSEIPFQNAEETRQILLVSISGMLHCSLETCMVDDYTIGCLLMYNHDSEQEILDQIHAMDNNLKKVTYDRLNVHIMVAVGCEVSLISESVTSYQSARIVLLCNNRQGTRNQELGKLLSASDYQDIAEIVRAVEEGDAEKCIKKFDGLLTSDTNGKYSKEQRVIIIMLLNLFDQTINGNARLKQLFLNGEVAELHINDCITLSEIIYWLRQALTDACRCSQSPEESKDELCIIRVVQYIQRNYADCNLSLATIAEEFNMNATTLSAKFKKMVGSNMSSYVRNLRIKQICELLENTELSLLEIAERTGLGSVKTMHRIFKLEIGMTPGQYREQKRSSIHA